MFTHLVLDVDAAPGILSASVPQASGGVRDGGVGAHHSKWHPLPHPVVLSVTIQLRVRKSVNLNLMLLKLQQNLKY